METTSAPPWASKLKKNRRGWFRRFLLWGFLTGLVVLLLYGLQPKPIPVELVKIQRGDLTVKIVEEGRTRIKNRYIVSSPVVGTMQRVSLRAGSDVIANKTLLTNIRPTISPLLDSRTKLQAEARVLSAKSSLARAEEGLEMAKTASQFAFKTWDRVKNNLSAGGISSTDRDKLELDAQLRQKEVKSAELAVQVATYELAQAEATLVSEVGAGDLPALLEVKAPISGKILKVYQESESPVSPGAAIVEIGDLGELEIEAEVLSKDAISIRSGAHVQVEQWGGESALQARIRGIEPAAFTKVSALGVEEQRVLVLADFVDAYEKFQQLGDRYRVELHITVWEGKDLLLVPMGALFREGGDWMCYVKQKDKAEKRQLTLGQSNGQMSEVLSGLIESEEVLLYPPDTVSDGTFITENMKHMAESKS